MRHTPRRPGPFTNPIALPAFGAVFSAPAELPIPPSNQKMKIRLLLLTAVCALAAGPGLYAADTETELGAKMDKMSSAFRVIGRQVEKPDMNADSLAKLAVLKENANASLKLEPAMKAEKPAAEQAKFVADYQAKMKEFIALVEKLEVALKANDNAEATKLVASMRDAQKAGHKQFKKDDKKKK
jgi:hypothetical protein